MLDEKGFHRKTYTELLEEMETEARAKFGEDINTSIKSPLGVILRLYAWFLGIVWMLAEKVYYSGFVSTAEGVSLDRVLPYGGIKRFTEDWARGEITITGEPNTTVEAGFQVSTKYDVFFETLDDLLLDDSGTGTVAIQALEPGPNGNVLAGEIDIVVQPSANVFSAANESKTDGGRYPETDAEVKARYARTESRGASTLDSIYSEVSGLSGVRTVKVIENDNDTVDEAGRPPHSFETIVLGGAADEIAQAIFRKKPAGIKTHGSESVTVKDLSGTDRLIKFSFADVLPVYVKITVSRNATFPVDGVEQLRSQIIQYIGGLDENGSRYPGLGLGEDVILSRALRSITVPGIEDIQIEFSTNGTDFSAGNIPVGDAVAETSYDKVVIDIA